jgi:adenine-specific DNA-methyltransferase
VAGELIKIMATGTPKTNWNGHFSESPDKPGFGKADSVELTYPGKKTVAEILSTPAEEIRLVWQPRLLTAPNQLYFANNLTVLRALLADESVKRKVRLIYIDPPFATKMVYQSRRLSDAYMDILSGAHYIEFLRERLVLLRELLADDGSIYVHLDENMAFHVKVIMDEVFGAKNYRNWITRKKCNPKNYTKNTYGNVCDFILFYSKNEDFVWNRPLDEWTPERIDKEYEYVDEKTGRRYKKVPVHAPGVRRGATGQPWRGMPPPPGKHWQFVPDTLDEMDSRGEIYWSPNGNPRRKVFLDQSSGIPVQDLWLDCRDAHNQNIRVTGYPTEKNSDVLRRIIKASSDPGDLVLDCFAGSGTTLAVAAELGRRWIGVDNSSEAISTILHRFVHGSEMMGDFVQGRLDQEENVSQHTLQFSEDQNLDKPLINHASINDFKFYAAGELPPSLESAVSELAI